MMKVEGPYDLSLPVETGLGRAWYIPGLERHPVQLGSWIGSVAEGGVVNFMTLHMNPHAHGSHTETLGHICTGEHGVHKVEMPWIQSALVVSIAPKDEGTHGLVISWEALSTAINHLGGWQGATALIVRTLPNDASKRTRNYSQTDAPYFSPEVGSALADAGILHWLVDLPSVDREEDGGALACHRTFWCVDPGQTIAGPRARTQATISELIYVPSEVSDGLWKMQLFVAPIASDAAPCRPLLLRFDHEG